LFTYIYKVYGRIFFLCNQLNLYIMKTMFQTPKMQVFVFAIACCCLLTFNSCEKNEITPQEEEVAVTKSLSNFERQMLESMTPEKRSSHLERRGDKIKILERPVVSNGVLCPDSPVLDDAIPNSRLDLGGADYWTFYGVEGDLATIDVTRISCGMDPWLALVEGIITDTDELEFALAIGDDEVPAPASCASSCFAWADPSISGNLPYTGFYTVIVADWLSCGTDPLSYQLLVTGIYCDSDGDGCYDDTDPHPNSDQAATVIIDGCDSGVANVFPVPCSTMADLLADCAANSANHDEYVDCVAQLTNGWVAEGLITGRQKGKIQSCAGMSGLPY
jgi:hypothetical protein